MQTGMEVPADRSLDECTVELVEMLGHPNPRWREDLAYPLLTTWIDKGVYDDLLAGLGDGIVPGLRYGLGQDGDVSVLRRSYSALMLAEIIGRDNNEHLMTAESVLDWGDVRPLGTSASWITAAGCPSRAGPTRSPTAPTSWPPSPARGTSDASS